MPFWGCPKALHNIQMNISGHPPIPTSLLLIRIYEWNEMNNKLNTIKYIYGEQQ
jgi:hypothetical protein